MAWLQRYSSHGITYYRIVESYRRLDGKPTVRALLHLGKAEDLLARLQGQRAALGLRSVASGAVDAACRLAQELACAQAINWAIASQGGSVRRRDGLTTGESLVAAAIARLVHPCSKRAWAEWAAQTSLPARLGVKAEALTRQHFWDQMDAVPLKAVEEAEQAVVSKLLQVEALAPALLAYDTTNFYTHLETTNGRSVLAQRGHHKPRRHDLRQLGLALVVSEEGQIPLTHVLYEGSRNDLRSFQKLLEPLRRRLKQLWRQAQQLTLVFDQGAESRENLGEVRREGDHYVTALKSSDHKKLLAEAAGKLEPVSLASGQTMRAWRRQGVVEGQEQTRVVVWSETLYEGQRRGLEQHLGKALREMAALSPHPGGGEESLRRQVARWVNRQYVRQVLQVEVRKEGGEWKVIPKLDEVAQEKLEKEYFGLRLLATSQHAWSTAEIIEAYRGQWRVEGAFRDLKDPWLCAFRPQYHWTDQKLVVHALMAFLSLLLGRVLLRRARERTPYRGTLRNLMQQLSRIRTATVIERQQAAGRPRVYQQVEECDPELTRLGRALGVLPS